MKTIGKLSTGKISYILYFLFAFFKTETSCAQNHLNFKHLTINEGLSQNTVFAIMQDKTGFIWIGTEDGLNKYDGYEFTIYKHRNNDANSLSDNQVNALLEDPKGNIWVGTSSGLNLFNKQQLGFTKISTGPDKENSLDDFITSFLYDSYGNLWIGTYGGLKRYDYQQKRVLNYSLPPNIQNKISSNRVQTIFEDHQKKLWVSIGKDIKCIDLKSKKVIPLPEALEQIASLKQANVRTITQGKNGLIWFGTEHSGLFNYNPKTHKSEQFQHEANNANSLPTNIVRTLLAYSDTKLWIGTRDGLSILDLSTRKFINYQNNVFDNKTISHNSVRAIIKDRAGNIWIGTYAGGINFSSLGAGNFSYIGEKSSSNPVGLSHKVVSSILYDHGHLWVGTEGGGLNYIDRDKNISKSYVINSRQQNIVKSLVEDENHNLWIGTYDGLSYFNTRTETLKSFEIAGNNDNKPENKQVYSLLLDDGGLWIGTDGRGLKFINHNSAITTYTHDTKNPKSISSNVVLSLLRKDDRHIYVGTDHGLNIYNKLTHNFISYLHTDDDSLGLQQNTVLYLFKDSKNRLWIGTEGGGVNYFDEKNQKFYAITETQGLLNSVVHGIREDQTGALWLSTNKGLSKIIFKQFKVPFSKNDLTIMNYTVEDGLQSNQFTSGAAEKGDHGELFFGGINGLTAFFPDKIIYNTFKPKVVITDFLIKNHPVEINAENSPLKKTISETDTIVLTYDQAFITFKFAALNYVNPEKNQYAYKLSGFYDDDWHQVGNQRTATYTNLDAGKYTFEVKAANNDGLWTDNIRTIHIKVLPPWWKTWWAYTFYFLMIGSILYFINYYTIKTNKLKHDLALQNLSHEKEQELAQRKLSFFTNISHEIKTPLTLILAPIDKLISLNEGNNKTLNHLKLIQRNGERLIRLINQLLDFRKFESGSMKLQAAEGNIIRFTKEVMMAFEAYANQKNIQLKLITTEKSIRVWFDRDKMEKVLYNLLSNALKFTDEGGIINISVTADAAKNTVIIGVEDNGIGIPASRLKSIFDKFNHFDEKGINAQGTGIGLAFSKGLVELHSGSLTVESEVAFEKKSGRTCFKVELPLGKEHLSEDELIANYKDSENIDRYIEKELPESSKSAIDKRKQHVLKAAEKEKLILLIVEDNPDVLQFVAAHFEDFEVHTAANGQIGFEKALEIIPDIIISDVMMPEMDGVTLCSKLKTDTQTSHIPIILLTARSPIIYNIEGLEKGADDYITKPFNLAILEARVWNLLDNRQKLRERYSKEITLQPKNVAITSPDEKFLEKVMRCIEQHIDEPEFSVEELGKEIGMSRVTLYRKIKALTNQTAVEFIRSTRLKRAAQLLETKSLNVNEVAYMVGFLDIDYFRRCFKDEFGHTPKEFANNASSSK